ncbi:RhoGEF domain-containing protein [Lactarius deliciosus]|nr:RhoGEF domain-containing protein [Lactarius deliciosus]
MEYLLKTDIASQPLDYDLGLPTEELLSSAVHPPVHLLVLENDRGLPQNIEVHASDKISEIGVTIEDVLKTVNDCLLKPSGQRERHVHIASNDDDQAIDVSTISDDVVHLTDQDSYMSTSTFVSRSRAPIDQDWWSLSYSGSIYSRSTLVYSDSSSSHEDASSLQQKPYDLSWQPVDEDDEIELIIDVGSEDTNLEVDDLPEVEREERTSAVVIAEEGRGLIVHGDGVAIADLVVQPGTTHLLIGSSRTAGALPQFLTTALPTIGTTLLALDISANFLATLPPALESCVCLEELNISLNPLRSLPLFIAHLTSLRVLIADSTGITTLPAPLSALDRLHTLSIRRNKMYSLPSWLCLLVSLQTLLVDGNSFQGPWKALMEPLLTKGFSGLPYSPSTSILPPLHPTVRDIDSNTDTNATTPSPRSTSFEDSRQNPISLIDVRLSSTGSLGMDIPSTASKISVSPPIIGPKEVDIKEIPLPSGPFLAPSPGLLSVAPSSPRLFPLSLTTRVTERRSFLPVGGPPTLSPPLPSPGPFSSGIALASTELRLPSPISSETIEQVQRQEKERVREAYTRALRSVMAYLRDMNDLSATQLTPTSTYSPSSPDMEGSGPRSRQPTTADSGLVTSDGTLSSFVASRSGSSDQSQTPESIVHLDNLSLSQAGSIASANSKGSINEERKFKDDGGRRMKVIKEIVETERGYVRALQELIDIYIKPAAAPVNLLGGVRSTKETVIPTEERRIVFSGFDSLFSFHKDIFLPALELAADSVLRSLPRRLEEEAEGTLSANAARGIARTFVSHAAFMRMYSTYINNFDHSVQRIKQWVSDRPGTTTGPSPQPPSLAAQATGAGAVNATSDSSGGPQLTSSQRKRIKSFLKRCRRHPRHSQLNLEGYLLAPVSRIPRYRLLLEELARSTPPAEGYLDPLDQALDEISSLATNIIEGKRESESRSKLVQWQSRIRGKFPSPLVQPHRRFIMDGPLPLTRVVRKATTSFEVIDSQGDTSPIQVECLSPEQTPRPLLGILCNDMLVLCRDRSDGKDHLSPVDLWAVLRMQTLPQPASILHGNVLRIVDNKAILYFETSSTTVALNWSRAINLHIPTSKA